MSAKELYVELLGHTPDPEATAALGARLCYSGADVAGLRERVNAADQSIFIKKLTDMGHMSPIEHVGFTFGVEGVSRSLLAQITRHRIASFSVQSQRYVNQSAQDELSYIVPPRIQNLGEAAVHEYEEQMNTMRRWYERWCDELGEYGKEDARFVLPNAAETKFVMTMNARELQHMMSVRCCMRAQWEIRAMAWAVLGHCISVAPNLFALAGPGCAGGECDEGAMSCRRWHRTRERLRELRAFVDDNKDNNDFARALCRWCSDNTQ